MDVAGLTDYGLGADRAVPVAGTPMIEPTSEAKRNGSLYEALS